MLYVIACRSAPAARSRAARSSARASVLGNWNEPVSVMIPTSAAVAISGVQGISSASMTRDTSSALAALVASTRFVAPNRSFDAWWSMFTIGGRAGRANFARSTDPKSTVTTRSTSLVGGSCVNRSVPLRKRCGSGTGSAQGQETRLPSDSRPRPRARADPMVSGSGSRCDTIAIRSAWRSERTTSFIRSCAREPRGGVPRSARRAPPSGPGRT